MAKAGRRLRPLTVNDGCASMKSTENGKRKKKKEKWIRGLCGGESLMLDDSYYAHSHGKSLSFLPLRICLKENHYAALLVIVHLFQFHPTAYLY